MSTTRRIRADTDELEWRAGRLSLSEPRHVAPRVRTQPATDPFPALEEETCNEKGKTSTLKGRWRNGASETVKRANHYW